MKKEVAYVYMDFLGRIIVIDDKEYNVHDMAAERFPDLEEEPDLLGEKADEVEKELLVAHGVTHVVCSENFGDEDEHPVEDYYATWTALLSETDKEIDE